jgi:hypothetical protein
MQDCAAALQPSVSFVIHLELLLLLPWLWLVVHMQAVNCEACVLVCVPHRCWQPGATVHQYDTQLVLRLSTCAAAMAVAGQLCEHATMHLLWRYAVLLHLLQWLDSSDERAQVKWRVCAAAAAGLRQLLLLLCKVCSRCAAVLQGLQCFQELVCIAGRPQRQKAACVLQHKCSSMDLFKLMQTFQNNVNTDCASC